MTTRDDSKSPATTARSARVRRRSLREPLLWIWALVATLVALLPLVLVRWTSAPVSWVEERLEMPKPLPDLRVLRAATFEDLPGWSEDPVTQALPAFLRSCARFQFRGPNAIVRPEEVGGRVADWLDVCQRAARLRAADDDALREFFESTMTPIRGLNNGRELGTFTGYYEPFLDGSRRRQGRYTIPLYKPPGDIISVDLGEFRDDLGGRSVAGRLQGRKLLPYWDRGQIVGGALANRGLELAWVDDPVDAFFLQIQGSGRVRLAEGGVLRVGYAGQNGHPYYAIGRELIVRGHLEREQVSMQSIRAWLEANPEEADEVMATNASFVFFRELRGDGPLGAQGVALTPERSLAVDRSQLPLGAPIYLDAERPGSDESSPSQVLRRLMVAQDTGGAIRGPIRGDVFWGAGDEAAEIAGRMNHEGRYWLLLPNELAGRVLESDGASPDQSSPQ